jgi:hypothetical protein
VNGTPFRSGGRRLIPRPAITGLDAELDMVAAFTPASFACRCMRASTIRGVGDLPGLG